MLMIQLLKPGRDTMDLLSDRNLQSRHQNWRQTPNLVPWEKSRFSREFAISSFATQCTSTRVCTTHMQHMQQQHIGFPVKERTSKKREIHTA